MFKKETGYDEFLAESIAQGLKDYEEGRVLTLQEADKLWQATIDQYAENEKHFEEQIAYA